MENKHDMIFEIKIQGHLNNHWTDWICPHGNARAMKCTYLESGETVIRGDVEDQAALHGLLTKIRDLGLTVNSMVAARRKTIGNL